MIEIKHVSFTYSTGTGKALDGVSLTIEDGDFVGIIGESGAGKTTFGHCINGVVPHHFSGDFYGEVRVNGADTFETKLTDLSRAIGTVSQDIDSSMVAAVVEHEVLYGLENFGVARDQIESRVAGALEAVGISDLRDRRISTLSGGQKQKVALAAVIALRPQIVLLDEPTAELDPQSSRQIFELLAELNRQGITVIVIEQKVMLLCEYAKHLVVMEHGHVALDGPARDVLSQTERMVELGINCPRVATLGIELHRRGIGSSRVAATVPEACEFIEETLRDVPSQSAPAVPQPAAPKAAPPAVSFVSAESMLEFSHVSFGYKGHDVMHDVSLSVRRGEFVALLGPNGTGKSTTLRLSDGLLKPSAGTVTVAGLDTSRVRTSEIAQHVGFLFQNPDRQICQNTTRDEIAFGLRTLYGKDDPRVEERTRHVLELLHLDGDVDPFNLAKGQRQAVALGGLIAINPELLLLDEPTTGFDYSECMEMMEHIRAINRAGTTVVMVCHDMEVVLDFADRAVVMAQGGIIADGPVRDIFEQRDVLERASLLPPQICELSQRLAPVYPQLAHIYEVDAMADAVAALKEAL